MNDDELLSGEQAIANYFSQLLNENNEFSSEDVSSNTKEDIAASTVEQWQNIALHEDFQALYFEIFSVIYALPLSQLGNVYHIKKYEKLLDKPDWFIGLQVEDDVELKIIDMAKWAMPEKVSKNYHQDYGYIIHLAQSSWGLACNQVFDVEMVKHNQITWRRHAGKRPWLAGLVKTNKSVLLHVDALVAMLGRECAI